MPARAPSIGEFLMDGPRMGRRGFLEKGLAGLGGLALAGSSSLARGEEIGRKRYGGPNVIIVRFGGGVRRRETIEAGHSYCPYFLHELAPRGTLYTNMELSSLQGVETSHGQGTLHILTGQYLKYKNVSQGILGERFESAVPTVFEYFRKAYDVAEHETLIINAEDRTQEEFYSFSNHHLFGLSYRSNVLSLYRFKVYLKRLQIERGDYSGKALEKQLKELEKLEALDYRTGGDDRQSREIQGFWKRWQTFYGETGLVNPRGDRLLTELATRAIRELRPKLMMVNYNDPDYVHWGNPSHYTRGISIIDQGIKRLVDVVEGDEEYRDNTVFVVVPDCGRDDNRMMEVPYQHHFGSPSSHEIFALLFGRGVSKGQVVTHSVDQIAVASTVGRLMGVGMEFAESAVLEEALA